MAMGTERARETVRRLQRDVTSGRWPLNTRIPTEPELAAELGVGRSTVREAVRSLAHLGMLEPAPGRGTFVRSLNPVSTVLATFASEHSPADLLSLRQALEVQAAHQAAQSASPEEVTRLREAHLAGSSDLQDAETVDRERTPGQFHATLVEIGGNPLLVKLYTAILTSIRDAQRKGEVVADQCGSRRQAEHALILESIAAGNPTAATAAATQHASRDLVAVQPTPSDPAPNPAPGPSSTTTTEPPRPAVTALQTPGDALF